MSARSYPWPLFAAAKWSEEPGEDEWLDPFDRDVLMRPIANEGFCNKCGVRVEGKAIWCAVCEEKFEALKRFARGE